MKVDGHSHRTVANENDNEFDEETIRVFNRIILFSQRKAQLISGVPGNRKKGANVFSSQLVTGGSGRVQYQGEYLVRGEFCGRSAGSRTNKSRVTRYTSKEWQSEEQLGLSEDDSSEDDSTEEEPTEEFVIVGSVLNAKFLGEWNYNKASSPLVAGEAGDSIIWQCQGARRCISSGAVDGGERYGRGRPHGRAMRIVEDK